MPLLELALHGRKGGRIALALQAAPTAFPGIAQPPGHAPQRAHGEVDSQFTGQTGHEITQLLGGLP